MPVSKDVFAHTASAFECTVGSEQKTTMPLVESKSTTQMHQCHWILFLFLQIDALPTRWPPTIKKPIHWSSNRKYANCVLMHRRSAVIAVVPVQFTPHRIIVKENSCILITRVTPMKVMQALLPAALPWWVRTVAQSFEMIVHTTRLLRIIYRRCRRPRRRKL